MKKSLIIFALVLMFNLLNGQTGIGTTTPNASAKLDVYSTNKGFLPPRVTLTSATDATTIASPAEGLLVYNIGSVGLQAGYYYWNGANWATIATATSAGNGVTAMDMVKLYGEAHSSAAGKISSATGYVFTVPVSGRYLFDFTSSATTLSGGTNTLNFQVRQGSTVLGSDMQSSYNNNVHVEYNGKVEVNLQAGVSYNVYNYATSGSFEANDYDRVYYKLVAGNLPVTGQSVDYISTTLNANISGVGSNTDIILQQLNGGNIPYNSSTGVYSLSANKTYMMQAQLRVNTASVSNAYLQYTWVDAVSNTPLVANSEALNASNTLGAGYGSKEVVQIIYTPTTNQTIKLRSTSSSGTQTIVLGSVNIIQIGSSAIINPWVLSGNDVYNTTGDVGIGTSSPSASALLDISSTNKGILIPRMTASQKSSISSPTTGLLIYQTDAPAGFYYYNGSSWISISNPGTTTRFLPHSSNFTHLSAGQSLTSLASGSYVAIGSSDLVIDVPSGYSNNKVVIKWDTWGDVTASSAAHGSFRYQIKQTGTSTATYGSAAMNGWAVTGSSVAATRFATPVTYILTDLAPGTYTFKLEISREAEVGTITNMNNYHVSGSVQVFVK